jgi:Flp pilus assembly protein CpaB
MSNPRFSVTTFVVCALSFASVVLIKHGAHLLRGQSPYDTLTPVACYHVAVTKRRDEPEGESRTTTVLVAKQQITAFTKLNNPEQLFEERKVPPLWIPTISSAVRAFEEMNGKQLRKPLPAGAILYKDDVREWESREQLEAKLQPSERPRLFYVNREDFAEGTTWPGCRVDLILDHEGNRRVLCRNRLLLGIDQRRPRDLPPQFDDCWLATAGLSEKEGVLVSLAKQLGIVKLLPATPDE